jgi:alcohol dehydrogenase YqhD (iron-dependent ADH family)
VQKQGNTNKPKNKNNEAKKVPYEPDVTVINPSYQIFIPSLQQQHGIVEHMEEDLIR